MTSPQFAVLYALCAEQGVDQKTLGERVSLDRSTTTEVLKRLTRRGLVRSLRDTRDGRRNRLHLTPSGKRTVVRLTPRAVRMNTMLVSVLNECERTELLRMLNLVVDADERLQRQTPGNAKGR